jgi:hypothetical protein
MSNRPDPTALDGSDGSDGAVARVTARLARVDLDAATFELITAALTADVCDQVENLPH